MIISLIVVADENNAIGKGNQLLCHLPADLKHFKNITTGHCILMGRKTYESIGRPLPIRTNMVLTRSDLAIDGCYIFKDIDSAKEFAEKQNETELCIIGGDNIFKQTLNLADKIYLTRIHHTFSDADVYFPVMGTEWKLTKSEAHQADEKNPFAYTFEWWEKV